MVSRNGVLLLAGVLASSGAVFPAQAHSSAGTGTVAGLHYFDRNADGAWQPGEPGGGSAVGLYRMDGGWVATAGTEPDGGFVIPDVPPGRYRAGINPIGYQLTTASEVVVDVVAGATSRADFGKLGGDITGVAWHDLDADGQRQTGEPSLGDIRFWIGRWGSATDATGHYALANQGTGTYSLRFVAPEGIRFSPKNAGAPATDSDADPATGVATAVVALTDGRINQVPNLDIGLVTE
ncbi:carboxypeptidase regulatory-like domain-containing protein [Saccharopolyspora erythraea]|uniref:SdrD B-like domain-containing protein n=1 Tax=Saccharopolyspora erythraea TaxID=1836 RepID=UPI001BAB7CF7|nr:SdrD B-like domain-containing protein [Saccharopolyspora erythraea]QUH03481.1 carboxypeptidase regulatory-like domain-containing protein [Saccharopolyspora erythraea]